MAGSKINLPPVQAPSPGRIVGRPVLVYEFPLSLDQQSLEVIVGVAALVARGSVAHFEIDDVVAGLVDQAVRVPGAALESRAHSRRKPPPALVGVKGRVPLEDVGELVLPGVRVSQRRD